MAESLETVLADAGVEPALASGIMADGWTLRTFREIAATAADFTDALFAELCPHNDHLTLLQKASIRSAWRNAQQPETLQGSSTDGSVPVATSGSAADGSWSEVFPPKLNNETVTSLKKQFLQNYPSEVLTSDTQPSARLLALAYQLTQKKDFKWLPWKFRMSMSRSEDMAMSRASKAPRLENLQLHQLLIDEVPSLEINNQSLGLNALRQMFEIHNYAWSLVGACHLHRLRAYTLKFMSLLSVRLDQDSGLRAPNMLEAQQADKTIWYHISELCESATWSLDDALLEFTQNRGDLATLLQPRPRLPKISPAPTNAPSKGQKGPKGGSKGAKSSKGGSKPGVRWLLRFGEVLRKRPYVCDTNQESAPTKIAVMNMPVDIPNRMAQLAAQTMPRLITIKHHTDSWNRHRCDRLQFHQLRWSKTQSLLH